MRNLRAFSRVPFSDFWPNELKIPAALQEGEGGDLDLGGELGTNAGHCFLRLRTPPPPYILFFNIFFLLLQKQTLTFLQQGMTPNRAYISEDTST